MPTIPKASITATAEVRGSTGLVGAERPDPRPHPAETQRPRSVWHRWLIAGDKPGRQSNVEVVELPDRHLVDQLPTDPVLGNPLAIEQ
jgi:hypothetical protein